MFCPRCGTQAPDDAAACTLCGLAFRTGEGGRSVESVPAQSLGYVPGPPPQAVPAPVPVVYGGFWRRFAGSQAVPAPVPVVYGGFWRRFAGCVIDAIVTFFPAATVRVLLGLGSSSMFDPLTPTSWWAFLFEVAFDWLYAALLISSRLRGTLGQLVMDLNVTDLRGERVTFARASGRYVAQILNLFTLGIGLIAQVFTPRRQALHDLVSGTVVVRPARGAERSASARPPVTATGLGA